MYTIILDQGIVIKDSTGQVVAPCQSDQDPEFRTYIEWVESGNSPTVLNTDPNK